MLLTPNFVPALAAPTSVGVKGTASHEDVLLGMHFMHERADCNVTGEGRENVVPSFWDYVESMPEDLGHMSYADFWHWWYEFERYKGDERGLDRMDRIVDECLHRGMKVKVDVAWTTYWTNDLDWETGPGMNVGPVDVDDWVHLCDLLARRYKGRIALWMLQGEAADLKNYWQGKPIEFVSDIYRQGSRAFKRIDPDVLISIAGASPSVPREVLDDWVRVHAAACKGTFDDVPMNFFADCADPYKGLRNYYMSIRNILDKTGETKVEVGSGESSVQWAETSYTITVPAPTSFNGQDPETAPLSEMKQAWRLNQTLGDFFGLGGNKFVMWGTEYAPGGGWAWRWGFRKYQDWWGEFPEDFKVEGTNIVYRYDNPDGRKVDLRPGWSSRQTDPFHPMWEVYKFWAQACPPGADAVRLPIKSADTADGNRIATYLQAKDKCVLLAQNEKPQKLSVNVDLTTTGWLSGAPVQITVRTESLDYALGDKKLISEKHQSAKLSGKSLAIDLDQAAGFTTIEISLDGGLAAEFIGQSMPETMEVGGKSAEAFVVVRNTGKKSWEPGKVSLGVVDGDKTRTSALSEEVKPGECTSVKFEVPPPDSEGRWTHSFRMQSADGRAFGPAGSISFTAEDLGAPRKLVAHRELGHVRVQWFAPEGHGSIKGYELFRAEGLDKPFRSIVELAGFEYIDSDIEKDKAYFYRVMAVDSRGRKSRPSNEDNAKASSKARIYDAEITAQNVPGEVELGVPGSVSVTIKNTGTKPWNLGSEDKKSRVSLQTTQQWGLQDESRLPNISLGSNTLGPGDSVKVVIPYSAPRAGIFENHWVISMDVPGKSRAYFGTPLLTETTVR